MQNLLTHTSGLTRVVTNGILMESDERPVLPFGFDALYYEPPTNLAFKVQAGEQRLLTPGEIAACEAFCAGFLDSADYPVHAMDASQVYAGTMLKTEAHSRNLDYRIAESPDHPASQWTGEKWERLVAVILDDGTLHTMPDAVCDRCTLVFTESEWSEFPQTPERKNGENWHWSFIKECWEDRSDPWVFAYDDVGAFVGNRQRSTLLSGWGYTFEAPEQQAMVMRDAGWERVAAVIDDRGYVETRPHVIRDNAILLFTREEWARWPQRPASTQGEVWAWDFVAEDWRDVAEIYVAAFEKDGEQAGAFAGSMMRSEADARGLGWTRVSPDRQAAKWTGEQWEPLKAVVMDDGTVRLDPEGVCQRCMLLFTAAEWAAFPQPEREIPAALGGWQWNYVLERWEDRRETEALRKQAKRAVRGVLHWRLREGMGNGLLEEAALFAGNVAAFTDAFAAVSGKDRAVLEAAAAAEYADVATVYGRCAGRIFAAQKAIDAAVGNAGIDAAFAAAVAEESE